MSDPETIYEDYQSDLRTSGRKIQNKTRQRLVGFLSSWLLSVIQIKLKMQVIILINTFNKNMNKG